MEEFHGFTGILLYIVLFFTYLYNFMNYYCCCTKCYTASKIRRNFKYKPL